MNYLKYTSIPAQLCPYLLFYMKPKYGQHNYFWYYGPSIIDPFTLIINDQNKICKPVNPYPAETEVISLYHQYRAWLAFTSVYTVGVFILTSLK